MSVRMSVQDIGPGMFTTERYVEFTLNGKDYSLFVDQSSVSEKDKTMDVQIVESRGDIFLVELPRSTMTAGSRVFVPKDLLSPKVAA